MGIPYAALYVLPVDAGASDNEKDLSPIARANSENPWGPKRSVGSFTSGVSGRARGDQSPRLRGAYAEIQIKVRCINTQTTHTFLKDGTFAAHSFIHACVHCAINV